MPDLPHAYPFRFVEPTGADRAPTFAPSAGDALPWRGHPRAPYPLSLAIEAMAQAALTAVPAEEPAGRVFLAGIENARLLTEIHPGDRLEATADLLSRYGPAIKVSCRLTREGTKVAEATLLLARDPTS